MLFVFLSHFTGGYSWTADSREFASYLGAVSMIASPTFVIVSGMVVGFLAATRPREFSALRVKLVDRGLFLLLFGHLILSLTLAPARGGFVHAYRASFITDAIAVAILVGPWLVSAASALARIALSAFVFLLGWWAILAWHPVGPALVAKTYFVGLTSTSGELGAFPVFPIIPWFAVYVLGTVVGEHLGKMYTAGDRVGAHQFLAKIGAGCFASAAMIHAGAMVLRRVPGASIQWDSNLLTLTSIYGKFPPGIVYLGFFGGAGILMLTTIFEIDRREKFPAAVEALRKIGRASLFVFTIQYGLYRSILPRLGLPYTPLWPVLFLVTVILLAKLAAVWDKHHGNRFLTVGITSHWRRHLMRDPVSLLSSAVSRHRPTRIEPFGASGHWKTYHKPGSQLR